ncbi:MAG: toll/interleukin-1 receptor domain-containing protein [Chloroflexi bacterium]|nr:toll/interleukin-1 receptor domain-containing protein [Chloroflexota bacterium]
MADQEQVKLLKRGAKAWNTWRKKNPQVGIDLDEALLNGVNLNGVNLAGAKLNEALLSDANLHGANLGNASLRGSWLNGTDLSEALLGGAGFNRAELIGANLRKADLKGTDLNHAILGNTIIAQVDLSQACGLESVEHLAPSIIAADAIKLSKGEIPEAFLRGCGLGDWEIESAKLYKPGLSNQDIININYKIFDLRASQSIQISPLFISYSHADAPFVEKLEYRLVEKGIRFWRDIHDMTSGRMEKQVDRAMRQNPTVILILSEKSTRSDWVEHEARLARELEKELGRDVLCPIALDDSWKSAQWPARLMEQIMEYNILDYSKWNDDKAFGQVFNKMIAGLDMFYRPDKESSA